MKKVLILLVLTTFLLSNSAKADRWKGLIASVGAYEIQRAKFPSKIIVGPEPETYEPETSESATFEPDVDKKWQIAVFIDLDDYDKYPVAQQNLISSLEEKVTSKGHVFLGYFDHDTIIDKNGKRTPLSKVNNNLSFIRPEYRVWYGTILNTPMPRVAIAPVEGGDILDYHFPQTEEELWDLLKNPPPEPPKIIKTVPGDTVLPDPLDKEVFYKEHYKLTPGSCGMMGCTIHGGGWQKVREQVEIEIPVTTTNQQTSQTSTRRKG